MSSSPEPLPLKITPDPTLGGNGRLRVELPHWAALVEVQDHDLNVVGDLGFENTDDDQLAAVRLRPGAYQVTVRLDGRAESTWASVVPGHSVTVPRGVWTGMRIEGALPAQGVAGTPRLISDAAKRMSLTTPSPLAGPDEPTALFVFIESGAGSARELLARLTLEEVRPGGAGRTLASARVGVSTQGRWIAAHLKVTPGSYILRDAGTDKDVPRRQIVHLPGGWQAQVFLSDDADPLLSGFTYNLARPSEGFAPASDAAVAAAAVLSALANDEAGLLVSSNQRLGKLLLEERRNPWLAVLAAHALAAGAPARLFEAAKSNLGPSLQDFLCNTIPDHPDVRALYGGPNAPSLDVPPMLRAGLRRILGEGAQRTGVYTPGSLLEEISGRLLADSPWTAWTEDAPLVARVTAPEARAAVMQAALPSSAPIFAVGADHAVDVEGLFRDLSLASAGYEVMLDLARDREQPAEGQMESPAIAAALEAITPESLSLRAGSSVERSQAELSTLKSIAAGAATAVPGVLSEPLTAEAIVRSVRDAVSLPPADDVGDGGRTLEDDAQELLTQAAELAAAANFNDPQLVESLRDLARRVLGHADLLVVTDVNDQPLYANGAVQVLSSTPGESSAARFAHMINAGRSGVITAQEAATDGWKLARRAVNNPRTGALQGYVQSLSPTDRSSLSRGHLQSLREVLPQVTLQTGLLLYGSADKREDYHRRLAGLVENCRSILPE